MAQVIPLRFEALEIRQGRLMCILSNCVVLHGVIITRS
jgi:hypothetical protein